MDTFVILVGYRELQKNSGVGGGRREKLKYSGKLGIMSSVNPSFFLNAP